MTLSPARTVQIVPSLLAADLARLGDSVRAAREAGVEWISVDVMDGHFVPNLSFGPDHVRLIKKLDKGIFVDAHLMVEAPESVAPYFVAAGADIVTIHWEACKGASGENASKALGELRKSGVGAGLAIKPGTPVEPILEHLPELDLALIMTVEPGFGGAKFLEGMLPKVEAVRRAIDRSESRCWLQVDGGINLATVSAASAAGADSLVAGSAVFGAPDIGQAVKSLRERAQISFDSRK